VKNRFPASYTLLAALCGAVAWSVPYLVLPFIPRFPTYESPPYQINLAPLTISFFDGGLIAAVLFLIGLRYLSIREKSHPGVALSFNTVIAVIGGMAVGGAFASLFGFGIGYSEWGYSRLISLDWLDKLPEPYLSIGLVLGAAIAAIIVLLFSGLPKQLGPANGLSALAAAGIVLKTSGTALIGRALFCSIEFSSFVKYTTVGSHPIFFLVVAMSSGALFGALAWVFCTNINAVVPAIGSASSEEE
jgi:hypothetical protein